MLMSICYKNIGLVAGAFVLPLILGDNWILQLSLWNNVICFVLTGVAKETWMLFLGKCYLHDQIKYRHHKMQFPREVFHYPE